MLRDFFKTIGSFGIYLLAFFIPAVILIIWAQHNFFAPLKPDASTPVSFMVQDDWSVEALADALEEAGIIRSAASIPFLAKYKLPEEQREGMSIVPGEYELSPSLTPEQVLKKLIRGEVKLYTLQIPPGQNIDEVAAIIAESGLLSQEAAEEAMRDRSLLAALAVPSYIPEGLFIEGEYQVTRPSKPTELIASLLEQAEKKMDQLVPDWRARAKDIGYQPYDILKIASIIEEETSIDEERKTVSSLFHNRIRIGLPLQSDAALEYGDKALRVQGVTDEARKQDGPYNTFLNTELPLTPISSPGVASLEAALAPADTDFLYMVEKSDGTHDFSLRLREHLKKIKEYRSQILAE